MSSFIIEGGRKLSGEIKPQGAKNEALQIQRDRKWQMELLKLWVN